ncbi:hypothetical protein ACQP2T_39385 [Nonomuraea sp. CA-143628]|uniref:hypothetical protein n=1 Tax=Nonomuraea sp. CA-143628 TaxID=3239997 RepID=UPI003D8D7167
MTAPQHRVQLAARVQRLEVAVCTLASGLGDVKAAVDQLPQTIRQEILEYTEPVFGEIMAGNASLATKEQLDQLEQRLNGRLDDLKGLTDERFGQVDDRLDQMDKRFGQVDDRFVEVNAKLDQLLAALAQAPPR